MIDLIRPYLTTPYIALFIIGALYVKTKVEKFRRNRRIALLGSRGPIRPTWLPYGIDFLFEVIRYLLKDKNYELWLITFKKYAGGRYTIEHDGAERVILTSEPENIKAVLATQFKDYGKGEAFRLDFHDFLGDGEFIAKSQRT